MADVTSGGFSTRRQFLLDAIAEKNMTGNGLRKIIAKLNLTHKRTAAMLGVDGRTVRRWLSSKSEIPTAAQLLLALLSKGKVQVNDLEKLWEKADSEQ
jgi:DNA-binding transcriptional regulator YiaG